MAAKPKKTIGTIACSSCGHDVPVRQSDTGTLNFSCPWCDLPAYAKAGTEAHANTLKRMKPIAGQDQNAHASEPKSGGDAPAPGAKNPPPVATPAVKKTIFG